MIKNAGARKNHEKKCSKISKTAADESSVTAIGSTMTSIVSPTSCSDNAITSTNSSLAGSNSSLAGSNYSLPVGNKVKCTICGQVMLMHKSTVLQLIFAPGMCSWERPYYPYELAQEEHHC